MRWGSNLPELTWARKCALITGYLSTTLHASQGTKGRTEETSGFSWEVKWTDRKEKKSVLKHK